jgi:argininosuccinate lyase
MALRGTIVGEIEDDVLRFTAGRDPELDLELAEWDCIGTAAHVTMLSRMPVKPPVLSAAEAARVKQTLAGILGQVRSGAFRISGRDQDVHLAIERVLTRTLGDTGKKVHTGRSRNDQVAVDLRLYAKANLLECLRETAALADGLLALATKHRAVPMVGRTHLQPAMPSSVGLWASAYAERLLDDALLLRAAYDLNNRCPLGAAAGYGVALPIDRALTARLLDFAAPVHNVLHAVNARGKCEAAILSALGQAMLTLSRLAEDLVLFSMPEFDYFRLPAAVCTGSSIMPQKKNPDVLELIRAKAVGVNGMAATAAGIVCRLPGGYQRDLQETKGVFLDGMRETRASLRIMARMMGRIWVNRKALLAAFTPDVFATDRAMELVAEGMPFRDAYQEIKTHLGALEPGGVEAALNGKRHLGASGALRLGALRKRVVRVHEYAARERKRFHQAISTLIGQRYPQTGSEEA